MNPPDKICKKLETVVSIISCKVILVAYFLEEVKDLLKRCGSESRGIWKW